MTRRILIEALGVPMALDLEGLTDAEATAVRDAWRDAVVTVRSGGDLHSGGGISADSSSRTRITSRTNTADAAEPATIRVREPGDAAEFAEVMERLSQRVTVEAITARRADLWMLHAAGLALPDGRVLVLVGPSGRGKTTASRALGGALGYVSDETVAIDRDGRVWPYRKPLSIIETAGRPKVQRAPSTLGMAPLPGAPLRLAGIVLLDRRPDAGDTPVVQAIDLGDALEELVAQSSFLPLLDHPLRTMAAHVAAVGGVHRVRYREAGTLSAIVDRLVATPEERPGGRMPERSEDVPSPSRRSNPDTPSWYRVDVLDQVTLDDPDRIALLQVDERGEGTVRMLAGIAPTLWRAASGASRDHLVAACLAAHGAPEGQDAGALVDAAVADLAAAGLIAQRPGRWTIREDVAWTGALGRYVLLPLGGPDEPTALEGSAALIWQALAAGPASTADVTARVAELAGVDADLVRPDVEAFLADLEGLGVLAAR